MSQIIKTLTSGSPIPPNIPTSFVTQNGTGVPAANILIVNGLDSTENNANGIITKGGVVGTGTSNEVDVVITNRLQGTGTTVGATTADLVTFDLGATPATYVVEANFAAFESTTPAGAGYSLFGTIRTTGAAASLVGTPDKINNENAALIPSNADIIASGNNLILRVTGTAALTVNWSTVGYYVRVI